MISDGTFEEFECALSDDRHFIKEPITLPSCGHSACRACVPRGINQEIKCKLCDKITVTNRDLTNDQEPVGLSRALRRNLENLFAILEKQSHAQINQFRNCIEGKKETIELHVENIKSKVEMRVELIKTQIDQIHYQFRKQLDEIKINLMRAELSENRVDEVNSEAKQFEKKFKQLRKDLKHKLNLDEDRFYEYQNDLKKFNKLIKKTEFRVDNLEFKASNEIINDRLIGQLIFENSQMSIANEKELRNKIKNSKYEVIELKVRPYDVCNLPNNNLLTANRGDGSLTIFDSDYQLKRVIDKIDNKEFKPRGIAFNNRLNSIYILNELDSEIIMTDIDFNKLASYGSFGSKQHQFDDPSSMCFKNDYLYITDRNNERIQILTSELDYSNSFKLNFKPYLIKVSHKRICVTCIEQTNERGIYFYDSETFDLQQTYEYCVGRISELNSYFYLCCDSKILYCFNPDGILIKEIDIDRFNEYLTDLYDGYLFYFNQNLLITMYRNKKLLKF